MNIKVVYGKLAFGERRKEGERLLEFAIFFDLPVLKLVWKTEKIQFYHRISIYLFRSSELIKEGSVS